MKLLEVRIREFKSTWDSGPPKFDKSTTAPRLQAVTAQARSIEREFAAILSKGNRADPKLNRMADSRPCSDLLVVAAIRHR